LRVLQAAAVALGAAYACARLPGRSFVFDNLSNFAVHFGVAFGACAVLFARARRWAWAAAAAAAAAAALMPVVPWYFGRDAAPDDAARPFVKLLVSNVFYGNRNDGGIKRLIAAEAPDLVGLVEVDAAWLERLPRLRREFPYYFEVPAERAAGLALYSRFPLENPRLLRPPGEAWAPALLATVKVPGGDVEIVLVHPLSPLDAELTRRRNEQIRGLAEYARSAGRPLVMAGDFNLTMWNSGYRPLVDVAGLHNARQGHGVDPTWPSIWKLGVPIDHVLGTPDVRFRNFRVLGGVGSDHFPVSAEFSAR
jgi:endonuclease/exonuclease/phosphatase (EEP) superfamily protein YafD